MKKVIFGVFAHPDDEAFMLAGTLLKETRAGAELHLILLTAGGSGANPDNVENLAETRLAEWHAAGNLLGATGFHFLGFSDGNLSNKTMIEASEKIQEIVTSALASQTEPTEVEFMAFDFSGITGHIDHIVASRAASKVFYGLGRPATLKLVCLPRALQPQESSSWIFMERGRDTEEIDEIIDATELKDDILTVMQAHHSQRADYDFNTKQRGEDLGKNYFIVKKI